MRRLLACLSLIFCMAGSGQVAPVPVAAASSIQASDRIPICAFDGKTDTRWASAGNYQPEWLQLDFGKPCRQNGVKIQWEAAFAKVYEIQLSDDGAAWRTVFSQANGQGGQENCPFAEQTARFVRVFCLKAGPHPAPSIWEVIFTHPDAQAQVADLPKRIAEFEKRNLEQQQKATALKFAKSGIAKIVFCERTYPSMDEPHWYANFSYYVAGPQSPIVGRQGKLCILDLPSGAVQTLLDDRNGTVRDPVVSYDATKILFSYRKGGTAQFHLYEINADGTNLKQLTDGIYDDIEPCYLPDGGIVFVSSRAKRWVNCWISQVATIHRCDADGSNIRGLSANVEMDNTPWVMPDGRILYMRWEYVDRDQGIFQHLWTMNPDGSGQMVYFGNMHTDGISCYLDAKPIPGTDRVVFIKTTRSTEHNGSLCTVTAANGPDDLSAMKTLGLFNNGWSYGVYPAGYRDPYAVTSDLILVAKDKSILLVSGDGKTETTLFSSPVPVHEPRPLVARAREPAIPAKTDLGKTTGTLILTNAYFGRNMNGIKPGEIKKLVVMESLPKPVNYGGYLHDFVPISWSGSFTLLRLLGTVPVEADGSARFEVPANRAIVLYAADANGVCLKRMHSFLTAAPGESISCIGCHENRTIAPLPTNNLLALKRPPSQIQPIPGMPEVFDFPRDIQPILDRNCVRCHNPDKPSGGADLCGDRGVAFSQSYFSLFYHKQVADGRNRAQGNYAPRTIWDPASPLMDKLTGKHHGVTATDTEIQRIRLWINNSATYPGTYAALGTGSVKAALDMSNSGVSFPETAAAMKSINRRCATCHQNKIQSITSMSGWKDNASPFIPHRLYNLTRPEKSSLLMKPLAKAAGGLGMAGKDGKAIEIFKDADDSDYQAILAMVKAAQSYLDQHRRFDMPGFKPSPDYIREMKRYGILPETFDVRRDPIDPYETDRRYWASFWCVPPGQEPKFYPNPVMNQLLRQDGPKRDWETDFTQAPNGEDTRTHGPTPTNTDKHGPPR